MSREPLYRRHLGAGWGELPAPIRRMHEVGDGLVAEGRAEVVRGRGLLARVAAAFIGAPGAGPDVPVSVSFEPTRDGERWRRSFGGRGFESRQAEGRGAIAWKGTMVDQPVIDRARLLLQRHAAVEERQSRKP